MYNLHVFESLTVLLLVILPIVPLLMVTLQVEPDQAFIQFYFLLAVFFVIFIAWLITILIRSLRSVNLFFIVPRKQRIKQVNAALIDMTVSNIIGKTRTLNTWFWPKGSKVAYACILASNDIPLDRKMLSRLTGIDFSYLIIIQSINDSLLDHDYEEAAELLVKLWTKYGITKYIYERLRECYLKMQDFTKLDELHKSYPHDADIKEVQLGKLANLLENAHDIQEQRNILEKIYKLAPENEKYTMRYLKLLQSFGEYGHILKLIKNSWNKINSINVARIALEILKSGDPALNTNIKDFVFSLKAEDSYGYNLLKMHAYMHNNDLPSAEAVAIDVAKHDTLISYILQLELAHLAKDTRLMSNALNGLLSTNISERDQ